MLRSVKRLGGQSVVYVFGDIITRATTFLLVPVYTRFLGPQGYGILSVTDLVRNLFLVVHFNLIAIIVIRFYHEFKDGVERRRFFGSLWSLLILEAVVLITVLELVGPNLFDIALRGIPYRPYGRYAIWISLVGIVASGIPLGVFKASQHPGRYAGFGAALSLLKVLLVVYFVVLCGEGIIGSLKGELYAVMLMAMPSFVVLSRSVKTAWSWRDIRKIALFGLPLVPYYLAAWGLSLSDRAILNHYVPLEQLGVYTLGYQFGMLVNMVVGSVNSAWTPYFMAIIIDDSTKHDIISKLVTYVWGSIAVTGLCVALLSDPAIKMMTTPSFYTSARVVPWVALGYVSLGFGIIPRNILLYQKQTQHVLLITVAAVAINLGLNLLLIPRFGIVAAAVNTFIGYLVSLLISLVLASRAQIVRYERSRIAKLLLVCLTVYIMGVSVNTSSPLLEALLRGIIMLVGMFLGLWAVRFYDMPELLAMKRVMIWSRGVVRGMIVSGLGERIK